MLFADRDYEDGTLTTETDYYPSFKPKVKVDRCEEKGYSVVSVKCKDRAKLMFDIVCTLTDMQYVVFHAAISSDGPYASQVFLQLFLFNSLTGTTFFCIKLNLKKLLVCPSIYYASDISLVSYAL